MNYPISIHSGVTVADLIEHLRKYDPQQRFLPQAVLPDGTVCNVPAIIGEVPQSNCGNGLPYLYIDVRCNQTKGESRNGT